MIRQLPLIPTILVVAAAGVMVWLGFWQLGRAEEKAAMIARFNEVQTTQQPTSFWPDHPNALFHRVEYGCEGPIQSQPRAGRSESGQLGWVHIVECSLGPPQRPMTQLEGLRWDLPIRKTGDVALGWSADPSGIEWEGGIVIGIVAPGNKIVADPPLAGLEPLAKPDPKELPNNHLAYAGQWFFFALTALVIYFFAVRSKLARRD